MVKVVDVTEKSKRRKNDESRLVEIAKGIVRSSGEVSTNNGYIFVRPSVGEGSRLPSSLIVYKPLSNKVTVTDKSYFRFAEGIAEAYQLHLHK